VRQFHNLDIYVELGIWRPVVQGQDPVDAVDRCHQGHQLGLTPEHDLSCNIVQWRQEPGEQDRVAKPMVATNKHTPTFQGFAAPDALEMTGPLVLGWSGAANYSQVAIGYFPGAVKVAGSHGSDPVVFPWVYFARR
jgi:hypothetical protein